MHGPIPPALASRPLACRFCGSALSPLQRLRGDQCERLACRHRSGRERALAQRDAELAARREAAARRWQDGDAATARVVWIERHATRLVPLSRTARARHAAHLAALAAAVDAAPGPARPPDAAGPESSTPLAAPLCTFCSGRCCRHGAATHAFVTGELLRRWLAAHPGRSAADAAADYLARLPRHHVEHSCLHHGRHGCTLPREMRSDICNRYACDALRSLQDDPPAGEAPALLAAMTRADDLGDVALLRGDAFRRLPRQRRPAR